MKMAAWISAKHRAILVLVVLVLVGSCCAEPSPAADEQSERAGGRRRSRRSSAEAAAAAVMVPITLLKSAVDERAVCMDGTPPAYHLDPGSREGNNSWIVNLEGGGWCNNARTCRFRKGTRHGSSDHMEKQIAFTGIMSSSPADNPDFYNWNRVKIRYCDGASFASDIVAMQGVAPNLPAACTDHLDATSCFFPQNIIDGIKTPIFLLNAAYDAWQIEESLAPNRADPSGAWRACNFNRSACNASQMKFLQDFRDQMVAAVQGFSHSKANGLFINSCFAHCQSELPATWNNAAGGSPAIQNKGIAKSVGDWYFDRSEAKAIDCPYPCDTTCRHII